MGTVPCRVDSSSFTDSLLNNNHHLSRQNRKKIKIMPGFLSLALQSCFRLFFCFMLLNIYCGWFQKKLFMKSQKSNRKRPLALCQIFCPIYWDGKELLCSMHTFDILDFINLLSLLFGGGCWRWRVKAGKSASQVEPRHWSRQTTQHQGRSSHFHSNKWFHFCKFPPNYHKGGYFRMHCVFFLEEIFYWCQFGSESGEQEIPRQMELPHFFLHFYAFSSFLARDVWLFWNKSI